MTVIDRILTHGHVSSMAQELTVESNRLEKAGHDVIRLLLGQPGTGAPKAALDQLQSVMYHDALGYTSAIGIDPLRERIAKLYQARYQLDISAERIVVTIGASLALIAVLLECFERGDKIAIPYPAYPPQRICMEMLGYEPVGIYTKLENNFQLVPDDLKNLPKDVKALLISSPSNPTGAMITPDNLKAISDHCRDNNILLISDEIYHGISYEGSPTAHSALMYDDNAIVINSFSKYFSMPGWRVGWLVLPEVLVPNFGSALRNLYLSPAAISQYAALYAMDCVTELENNVASYAKNRQIMRDGLEAAGYHHYIEPQGAFYFYVNIAHTGKTAEQYCLELLQQKHIAAMPGSSFDPERGQDYVRFSYAGATPDIERAMARL